MIKYTSTVLVSIAVDKRHIKGMLSRLKACMATSSFHVSATLHVYLGIIQFPNLNEGRFLVKQLTHAKLPQQYHFDHSLHGLITAKRKHQIGKLFNNEELFASPPHT